MKILARFSLLLASIASVASYIDDSMMRKYSTSYDPVTMLSQSTGAFQKPNAAPEAPTIHPFTRIVSMPSPKSKIEDKEVVEPPIARFDVEEIIRAEYDAWACRYGKTKEVERFGIFRSNFMKQMEFNLQTGLFFLLNEYGDMTTAEYDQCSKMSSSEHQMHLPETLSDLDDQVKASMDQSDDIEDKVDDEKVILDDYSFAIDFGDENKNDDEKEEFQDNLSCFPTENKASKKEELQEAPTVYAQRIVSMGSAIPWATSPQVQRSRAASHRRNTNRKSGPPSKSVEIGGFTVTAASWFGSVSPMGASVGNRKSILE